MEVLRVIPMLCLVALLGCGPSGPTMVPVSGVVTLDGVPVEGANVIFTSMEGGKMADGRTDAQGKFTLTTQDQESTPGVLEGEHFVTVDGSRVVNAKVGEDGTSVDATSPKIEWFLPQKYVRRDTSGLTQKVAKGMPPIELKLTTK